MRLALGETLAKRWRVLLLDRPGHGLSSRSGGADDASPMRQAALIHDALGRLGVKRPILVAHSLGGAVATAYALSFPDDVSGLVLIAPTTHPWEGGIAWYYSLATAPVIGPLFAWTYALPVGSLLVSNAIASVFAPQQPPADYQSRAGIMQVLRPKTFLANAQDVAALNGNLRQTIRTLSRHPRADGRDHRRSRPDGVTRHPCPRAHRRDPGCAARNPARASVICRITRGRIGSKRRLRMCRRRARQSLVCVARRDPIRQRRCAPCWSRPAFRAERPRR